MSALPKSVNYAEGLPSLPTDARCEDVVLRPINGATFSPNQTIQWDFYNSGFIQPDSIYLRYNYTITSGGVSSMIGCPVYAPFSRLNVLFGSNQVESQQNFSQTATMLSNIGLTVSEKFGLQSSYGYAAAATTTIQDLDGRVCAQNETGSFAAPLPCILSSAEKMIPAFATPQIRLELVVDSVANMFRPDSTAVPTNIVLSNVELCYRQVHLGSDVEAMVRLMPSIHIKTQSFLNTASVVSAGSQGQMSLVYNTRLASIKSMFLLMSSSQNDSNLWGDSTDITSNNGTYNITVAGRNYPQTPLNTALTKNGHLQALRIATGNLYSRDNCFAIDTTEWNYVNGDATTLAEPGKYIVGVDTEVIDSDYIMSGISSQNSSITVNITTGTATTDQTNVHLVINYDGVIEINSDGQATLKL